MALAITIGLIVLIVALRLLFLPIPTFARFLRRWKGRTSVILCSIAVMGGVVLIVASRH